MTEEKKLRPPYASPGQVRMLFDLLSRISPKKIDSDFVVNNKITTSPNAFKVIDAAKWLGITDKDNVVKRDVLNSLKLVGEGRKKFVKELIQNAYKELLEEVDISIAKKEDIINFFVRNNNFGGSQARIAAALFLSLGHEYGIEFSDELKKKSYVGVGKRERKIKVKRIKTRREDSQIDYNDDDRWVVIKIFGKVSATLKAKSQEELDDVYNNQLPKIIPALKLGLPKKEDAQQNSEEVLDNTEEE